MSKPTKPLEPKPGLSLEDLDKLWREPVKVIILDPLRPASRWR